MAESGIETKKPKSEKVGFARRDVASAIVVIAIARLAWLCYHLMGEPTIPGFKAL
ncbi:MAG: hypothetical protein ABSA46_13840 [Thermodesulfovibrionales bacterium]|jgi:hypothetical protein